MFCCHFFILYYTVGSLLGDACVVNDVMLGTAWPGREGSQGAGEVGVH